MVFSEQSINNYIEEEKLNLLSNAWNAQLDSVEANRLEEKYGTPPADDTVLSIKAKEEEKNLNKIIGLTPATEEVYFSNKDYNKSVRQNLTRQYAALTNLDTTLMGKYESWKYKSTMINADLANSILKEEGVPIKVSKDISLYDLDKTKEVYKKRERLEEGLAKANATGSLGLMRDLAVIGSAFSGAIGASELAGSLATAFLPIGATASIAKGASAVNKALAAKRVADVKMAGNTLRNINSLYNSAAALEGLDAAATYTAAALLRQTPEAKKAMQTLNFYKGLKDLSKIKYDSLSGKSKTLYDALTVQLFDAPIASFKRHYSTDTLQWDLYSEKDKATESLMALGLGTWLPGGLRFVGYKLGISPLDLKVKQIKDAKSTVAQQVALGEVSSSKGKEMYSVLDTVEKTLTDTVAFKYHPRLLKAVEELKQANISNKTMISQLEYMNNCIVAGVPIKISAIPAFESILTSIDGELIRRVVSGERIGEVFGSNIIRQMSKEGLIRIGVNGEYGLLGSRPVTALTEEQGLIMYEHLYKGALRGVSEEAEDNADMRIFTDYANRLKTFTVEIRDSFDRWSEVRTKKTKGQKVKKAEHVQLYDELKTSFRKFMLGEKKAKELEGTAKENAAARALGFEDTPTPELERADQLFEEWFSHFATVKEGVRKNGSTYRMVDFLDDTGEAGRNEGVSRFRDYLLDLEQGANDNLYLADIENALADIEQARLQNIINDVNSLGLSSDTDLLRIVGATRKNFSTLVGESKDIQVMDTLLSEQRMKYNAMVNGGNYADAIRLLDKFSTKNKEVGTIYKRAKEVIEEVQRAKKEGLGDFRAAIIKKLNSSEAFREKASKYYDRNDMGEVSMEWDIAFEHILKEAIQSTLNDLGVTKHLSGNMLARITKETVDNFKTLGMENPRVIFSLLDKKFVQGLTEDVLEVVDIRALTREEIANKKVVPLVKPAQETEETLSDIAKMKGIQPEEVLGEAKKFKSRIAAESSITQNEIFKPLEDAINISLTNVEMQAMAEVSIAVKMLDLMKRNPANAAEVITGAATQTMSYFVGAARSVEAKTQIVGYYMRSARAAMQEAESTVKGRSLLDVYTMDSSVKDEVNSIRVKMKYGEKYTENSDYARIAEILNEHEATMLSEFTKYGLHYTDQAVPLDMSKFKYMDAAMSNQDIDALGQNIQKALAFDIDEYIESVPVDEEGLIKSGNQWIKNTPEVKKSIEKTVSDIFTELNDLFKVGNDVHRRTALYIFRACDLDKMFASTSVRNMSMNEVRDAILNGTLPELINGDIYKIKQVRTAVREIVAKIIGPQRKKKQGIAAGRRYAEDGSVVASAGSKVYTLRTGSNNLAAVISGAKSAAFDEFEGPILFKNAAEEENALRLFGFNTLEDQFKHVLDKQARALYSFENFGSDPVKMAEELVDAWNTGIKEDASLREYLRELVRKTRKNLDIDEAGVIADKYQIHESAKDSIRDNIIFACGLSNSAPTAATRVIRALKTFLSVPLLALAGLKSIADTGTMTAQLMLNAMVSSAPEAYKLQATAFAIIRNNPDILDLFLGASVIENEDFMKMLLNDPTVELSKLSNAVSKIDKIENISHLYGNYLMNTMGRMASITNTNKKVAALSIQMSIGKMSNKTFKELPLSLQEALMRDGIEDFEWDFIRTHMVRDLGDYAEGYKGRKLLVDQSIMEKREGNYVISDDTIRSVLHEQGYLNITQNTINEFRAEMLNKVWCLTDRGADEMISVPSGRVMNWMRGGKPRNSVQGTFMEILTQFNSFGASMAYYNYGKHLSKIAGRETGISVLDIFNPNVILEKSTRGEIFLGSVGIFCTIALNMLIVDTLVNATKGNIQKPFDENGLHLDNYRASLLGGLGTMGTLIDMLWEGVEGAGQRGGGFSIHAAPSVANLLRTGYRVGKPLTSSKIDDEDRPASVAAAVAQEAARATGLKTLPLVSLLYQKYMGAWLDMKAYGGRENYENYIKGKERRGQVIMPWEENPTFFGTP